MILVVGATGRAGGVVARRLLQRGEDVRILVRVGSDCAALEALGARPVFGDLKLPESLAPALEGVDAVVTTASGGERGGADTPHTVDLVGNRNLIDAAGAAGVRHFVFFSALFASEQHPAELLRAKAATERHLQQSGLGYTILAPNGYLDVLLPLVFEYPLSRGERVTIVGDGLRRHSMGTSADAAAFAAACVQNPRAAGRRIAIGGPEAISWRDVLAAYSRALGREVPVRTIAPWEMLPVVPPVPGLAEFLSGLLAGLASFDSPVDMTEPVASFGVTLTTLDEFVRGRAALLGAVPAG